MWSEITGPKHKRGTLVHKKTWSISSFIPLEKLFYTDRRQLYKFPITTVTLTCHFLDLQNLPWNERKPRGFSELLKAVVVSTSWSENPCSCSEFSLLMFLPSSFGLKQKQAAKTGEPKVLSGTAGSTRAVPVQFFPQKVSGSLWSSC